MCKFEIKDSVPFIIPVFSIWITWLIGIINRLISGKLNIFQIFLIILIYISYMVFFFQVWENKILCSHCPYYSFEDQTKIQCYANYGIYKAWKYNPTPMNLSEKIQFIVGVLISIVYPLTILILIEMYLFFLISLILSIFWVFSMHFLSCSKCPNFSCPLNNVPKKVVDEYLRHNSIMRKAWEEKGYKFD